MNCNLEYDSWKVRWFLIDNLVNKRVRDGVCTVDCTVVHKDICWYGKGRMLDWMLMIFGNLEWFRMI